LLFSALSLIAGSWFLALATVLALVLVTIRLPKEEAMLGARFGEEYRAYQQQTGRFFPKRL
jgi:protein-S-isoprenylcysteine O-methyltransferase Ste14